MERMKTEFEKLENIKTAFKLRENMGCKRRGNSAERLEFAIDQLLEELETLECGIEKLENQLAERKAALKKKRVELKKRWLKWREKIQLMPHSDDRNE
ncbi:MAG TPA: hypothetical protein VN611_17960 [Patescibacteria group bacterium]|nr:hypothetical protein [Patescibacteria group bacterium]